MEKEQFFEGSKDCTIRERDFYQIIESVSADRIEQSINKLVSFGTRHTLSDTISNKTGIGAARRWIKKSFEEISSECNNCLEVFYQNNFFKKMPILLTFFQLLPILNIIFVFVLD